MKSKSCLTNLPEYLETLTKLVAEGHNVDVIYLDFVKVFDQVLHQRLLRKMKAHGIIGEILGWVEAWLSGRQQRVILNGRFSQSSPVKQSCKNYFPFCEPDFRDELFSVIMHDF